MNMDLGSPGAPGAQKKPDEVFSIETLKKKPALMYGSIGGAVVVIGLIVFGVIKMAGGKKGGGRADVQQALPVADAYVGIPAAPMPGAQP